jgi:hypothetical protein
LDWQMPPGDGSTSLVCPPVVGRSGPAGAVRRRCPHRIGTATPQAGEQSPNTLGKTPTTPALRGPQSPPRLHRPAKHLRWALVELDRPAGLGDRMRLGPPPHAARQRADGHHFDVHGGRDLTQGAPGAGKAHEFRLPVGQEPIAHRCASHGRMRLATGARWCRMRGMGATCRTEQNNGSEALTCQELPRPTRGFPFCAKRPHSVRWNSREGYRSRWWRRLSRTTGAHSVMACLG